MGRERKSCFWLMSKGPFMCISCLIEPWHFFFLHLYGLNFAVLKNCFYYTSSFRYNHTVNDLQELPIQCIKVFSIH